MRLYERKLGYCSKYSCKSKKRQKGEVDNRLNSVIGYSHLTGEICIKYKHISVILL